MSENNTVCWKDGLKKIKNKFQKILVISSKNLNEKFNISKELKKIFINSKLEFLQKKQIPVTFSSSHKSFKKHINNRFDLILCFGGGKTIDYAKHFISVKFLKTNKYQIKQQLIKKIRVKKKFKFIVIPSTAGSGSEATQFAVTYIGGKKYSIENKILLPDHFILDPKVSYQCSKVQKISSALDALCQGIESHWSKKSTHATRKISSKSINLIWNNIFNAILNNNFKAHKNLVIGSNLAGKAINQTKTTATHALSYFISKKYSIPHGISVALTLPAFIDFYCKKKNRNLDRTLDLLTKIIGVEKNKISKKIIERMELIGIELSLSKFKVKKTHIKKISDSIDPVRLMNNPIDLSRKDIIQIVKGSF